MKSAMRSSDKATLLTIRLMLAAIKQQEVDTRADLNDDDIIKVLTKMQKQRCESIAQFEKANRQDLVDKESAELKLIEGYLPEALDEEEVDKLITQAISESGATSIKEMGRVMGLLKSKLSGRADMGTVSAKVKTLLDS